MGANTRHSKADRVDNAPLREIYENSGLRWADVVRRAGWSQSRADNVRKALGLAPDRNTRSGKVYYRSSMLEVDAVEVCRALHIYPRDAGF